MEFTGSKYQIDKEIQTGIPSCTGNRYSGFMAHWFTAVNLILLILWLVFLLFSLVNDQSALRGRQNMFLFMLLMVSLRFIYVYYIIGGGAERKILCLPHYCYLNL